MRVRQQCVDCDSVELAYDEYRAGRVQSTLLADRPEEHFGERPASTAADDKQVGGPGRIDEHRCRMTLDHAGGHRHLRCWAQRFGYNLLERLSRLRREVDIGVIDGVTVSRR